MAKLYDIAVKRQSRSGIFPFSSDDFTFFSRGRYALAMGALRMVPRAGKGIVLLPSYICRSVTDSLRQFGCSYRFYPVTRDCRPRVDHLERVLGEDVSSLLLVNYFGFPQDISGLMHLCRERDVVVIEDNAHGFLSVDGSGRSLGSRGDIGIFSFPKTIYLPDGGGMVVNNPGILDWTHSLPSYGRKYDLHATFLIKRQVLKTFKALGIDQKIVGRIRRQGRVGIEVAVEEGWIISMISRYLLGRVDEKSTVRFKRRCYNEVLEICREEGLESLYGELKDEVCPYLVPIVARPGNRRDRVARILKRKGWKVSHWPDLPLDLDSRENDNAFWLRKNIMAVYLRPAVV